MGVLDKYNLQLPQERIAIIPARLGKRAGALVLDLILVHFLFSASVMRLLPEVPSTLAGMTQYVQTLPTGAIAFVMSFIGLMSLLYFSLFQHYLGATPAMAIMRIQTTTPTLAHAMLRNLFVIPLFPFSILMIVDGLSLLLTKQRWLERITRTPTTEYLRY